jgi:hypothetical protein
MSRRGGIWIGDTRITTILMKPRKRKPNPTATTIKPTIERKRPRGQILRRLGAASMDDLVSQDYSDPDRREPDKRDLWVTRKGNEVHFGIANDNGGLIETVARFRLAELDGVARTLVRMLSGKHPLVKVSELEGLQGKA